MAANLLACLSQEDAQAPYRFAETGIQVYSFEEALYHCFHKWRQSAGAFLSGELADWVQNALGLSRIASEMRALTADEDSKLSEALPAFLSLADYFAPAPIAALQGELRSWESRLEWERLKERADNLLRRNDAAQAALLYKQALTLTENVTLLNNMGIALMRQGQYGQAADTLRRACACEPQNTMLLSHLVEAHILRGEYTAAQSVLSQIEDLEGAETADTVYFRGEIQFYTGHYARAAALYEEAAAMRCDSQYVYRLSDTYIKLRQFEKALETLQQIRTKDEAFFKAQAAIHAQTNNLPAAIKCINQALTAAQDDAGLWILLAQYHRLDYDLTKAAAAADIALNLAPKNPHIQLEHARIRKAQGRMTDYQTTLHNILQDCKDTYHANRVVSKSPFAGR